MPAHLTQPFYQSRRTEHAVRVTIDATDKLNAAVMAYNVRREGRQYPVSETSALMDAVKQFNTRRLVGRC